MITQTSDSKTTKGTVKIVAPTVSLSPAEAVAKWQGLNSVIPGQPRILKHRVKNTDTDFNNSIRRTVLTGDFERLTFALASSDDANLQDGEGMTPLHHAAASGNRRCLRALVNSGKCDYSIQDDYGRFASDLALEYARDRAVTRLLVKKRKQQQRKETGIKPD